MKKLSIPLLLSFSFALLATAAQAETKMRPATESQISRHLKLDAKRGLVKRNGFFYRQGNPNGYKISHGRICVLFPNKRIDCSSVSTDGKDFRMTMRDGSRYPLGN